LRHLRKTRDWGQDQCQSAGVQVSHCSFDSFTKRQWPIEFSTGVRLESGADVANLLSRDCKGAVGARPCIRSAHSFLGSDYANFCNLVPV
jgi:hypothetical protein